MVVTHKRKRTPDEEQQRQKRSEERKRRNRESAERSRQKRIANAKGLAEENEDLKIKISLLMAENEELRNRNQVLSSFNDDINRNQVLERNGFNDDLNKDAEFLDSIFDDIILDSQQVEEFLGNSEDLHTESKVFDNKNASILDLMSKTLAPHLTSQQMEQVFSTKNFLKFQTIVSDQIIKSLDKSVKIEQV